MGDEDSSSATNRDRRRQAAASRRAVRGGMPINVNDNGNSSNDGLGAVGGNNSAASSLLPTAAAAVSPKRRRKHHHEYPLQFNFLSSLSQALSNIDRHNQDYFAKRTEGDDDDVIVVEGVHHNVQRMARMNKKKSASLPSPPNNFSSYLKFNRLSLATLLSFTICYLLVLICCLPMITHSNESIPTDNENHDIKRGASFQYIRGRKQFLKAKHAIDTWRERAALRLEKKNMENNNGTVVDHDAMLEKQQLGLVESIVRNDYFAKRDSLLLEQAIHDFEGKSSDVAKFQISNANVSDKKNMRGGHDHWKDAIVAWDKEFVAPLDNNIANYDAGRTNDKKAPGFVVLGMHRSGTSMLSGLLVTGFGYETGGPLIEAGVSGFS